MPQGQKSKLKDIKEDIWKVQILERCVAIRNHLQQVQEEFLYISQLGNKNRYDHDIKVDMMGMIYNKQDKVWPA